MPAEAVFHHATRVELDAPYNADFVAALKGAIPPRNRTWDPETKTWEVFGTSRKWADYAVDLLLDFFPDAIVENAHLAPPAQSSAPDSDFAALHLLPTAPAYVVAAAYKVLAKHCHPDRGGSDHQMQALNVAMDRLRERGAA